MLFGQSGGGAKIATLMGMPAARGLFHRAATMSGQQVTASGPFNATSRARALLDALKLPAQRVEEIATVPQEKLLDALAATDPVIGKGSLYFGPVLDERTLERHPFYPQAPAISAAIPMIIGNTHDETRLLIGGSDPALFHSTGSSCPQNSTPRCGGYHSGKQWSQRIARCIRNTRRAMCSSRPRPPHAPGAVRSSKLSCGQRRAPCLRLRAGLEVTAGRR